MASTTKISSDLIDRLDAIEDNILDWLASGIEVSRIAWKLGISRRSLSHWVGLNPDRKRDWDEASDLSGDALTDRASQLLRSVRHADSMARVQAAKNEAEYCRWLAGKRNRRYDDRPTVHIGDNVTNIGQLHLNALRQHGSMDQIQEASVLLLPSPERG